MDMLHPHPVVFKQPGGAASAAELQPELWKQWGEKKSHDLTRVKLVSSKRIPGKSHPLTSNGLLLLSRRNGNSENLYCFISSRFINDVLHRAALDANVT